VWTFARNSSGMFEQMGSPLLAPVNGLYSADSFGPDALVSADGTRIICSARIANPSSLTGTGVLLTYARVNKSWQLQRDVVIQPLVSGVTPLTAAAILPDNSQIVLAITSEQGVDGQGAVFLINMQDACMRSNTSIPFTGRTVQRQARSIVLAVA
jgi:hypothetical protein